MNEKQHIRLCIQDFKVFLKECFYRKLNVSPTEMQYQIADYLQGKDTDNNKRILFGFRGLGKTTITAAFVCWKLLRNLNEKVLIVSKDMRFSADIAKEIRVLLRIVPLIAHLDPTNDVNARDNGLSFDVAGSKGGKEPSVNVSSIGGALQGLRASLLIADDIESSRNSSTEVKRQEILSQVEEFTSILKTDEGSEIIVLGTPQSSESVYNKMEDRGYTTRIFPVKYPDDVTVYNGRLAPYITERLITKPELVGTAIDTRFTDEIILEKELAYGASGFKLQFMLDTLLTDLERYPLKTKDLIVTDLGNTKAPREIIYSSSPESKITTLDNVGFTGDALFRPSVQSEITEYEGSVMAVDISGRGKDETAFAIVNHLGGNIFVPKVGSCKGGYDLETLIHLSEVAKKYNVQTILIESNFGDGMFTNLLRPVLANIHNASIEDIRHNSQKELRIIDTLEPLMNQHRLIIDYSTLEDDIVSNTSEHSTVKYSLLYQLTHINRERGSLIHDDKLDALAMGVAYWNALEITSINTKNSLQMYKDRLIDKELEMLGGNNSNRSRGVLSRFVGF